MKAMQKLIIILIFTSTPAFADPSADLRNLDRGGRVNCVKLLAAAHDYANTFQSGYFPDVHRHQPDKAEGVVKPILEHIAALEEVCAASRAQQ